MGREGSYFFGEKKKKKKKDLEKKAKELSLRKTSVLPKVKIVK